MQLTVRDVVKLLNVSERTVYRWISERALPGQQLNGQYRFDRAELFEWATANQVNVSSAILEETETAAPPPELVEALQTGGVFHHLPGTDKASALRSLVGVLRLPADVDRELLLHVLLAREALESTAIGDGIAIPHVRNPIVLRVSEPTVTLCFLEQPVAFGALDEKPVHTLFTLISPTVKVHLHLLSRLAFALRDPELKALLVRQAGAEEILAAVRKSGDRLRPAGSTTTPETKPAPTEGQ